MGVIQTFSSFSLLIVEDDKAACDIIARMVVLRFPSCTIYTADNGLEGLVVFKEHAPDVVITDINMPGMDGVEMAREIRSVDAKATYIVLTAYSNQVVFQKFEDIGFCAYLLKPIDFEELFAAIDKCVAESKSQQH